MQEKVELEQPKLVEEKNTLPQPASMSAQASISSKPIEPQKSDNSALFDLLWRRLFAWILDSIIVSTLSSSLFMLFLLAYDFVEGSSIAEIYRTRIGDILPVHLTLWLFTTIYNLAPLQFQGLLMIAAQKHHTEPTAIVMIGLLVAFITLFQLVYNVAFLRSSLKATPGKLIYALVVEGKSGEKTKLSSLILREILKPLCTGFLGLPAVLPLLLKKTLLLQDIVSDTRVINISDKTKTPISHFAPFVTVSSLLLTGFCIYELSASNIVDVLAIPRLTLIRSLYGDDSEEYRKALWERVDALFYRYQNESNYDESAKLLTSSQLEEFDGLIKQIESRWNKNDPRLAIAYSNALEHSALGVISEKREYYLTRVIQVNEATLKDSYMNIKVDLSKETRSAYAVLAECYRVNAQDGRLDEKQKKQKLLLAYQTACLGLSKISDGNFLSQFGLLETKRAAARQLGDNNKYLSTLREITDKEFSFFQRFTNHQMKPTDWLKYPRPVSAMFQDLLELAKVQEKANDLVALDHTMDLLTRTPVELRKLDVLSDEQWKRIIWQHEPMLTRIQNKLPKYANRTYVLLTVGWK